MDLCLGFDDSDFNEKQKQGKKLFASYNAKICYPKWFLDIKDLDGQAESKATVLKFKGDYLYRQGQYTEAIPHYKDGIDALPTTNRIMKRELQDSLSRCCIHAGDITTALDITEELMQGSTTDAQISHVLQIQQTIYNSFGNTQDEITVLQKLISMHPYNANFWLQLGLAYSRLTHPTVVQTEKQKPVCCHMADSTDKVANRLAVDLKLSGVKDVTSQLSAASQRMKITDPVTGGDGDACRSIPHCLMSLTCYIRTKLLLRSVHATVGSFIMTRNEDVLKQAEASVQQITSDENIIAAATQHMKQDLYQEETDDSDDKSTDTVTQIQTSPSVGSAQFDEKWFSWIRKLS